MQVPLLLGHRGDRRAAPENTLSAFDLAMKNGCDGFELDVRLTADSQAIVFHDPEISGVPIASASFDSLSALNCPQEVNHRIPRLEEVIRRYAASAFLDIELKVSGLENVVIAQLTDTPPQLGFVVSSFLPEILESMAGRDSKIPLGFICEDPILLSRWRELPVEYVIPKFDLMSAELVDELHRVRRKVLVWTVNDPPTMRRMADLRIDGIISDDTKLMIQTLGE